MYPKYKKKNKHRIANTNTKYGKSKRKCNGEKKNQENKKDAKKSWEKKTEQNILKWNTRMNGQQKCGQI